jgi:hypothetical protein
MSRPIARTDERETVADGGTISRPVDAATPAMEGAPWR